MAQDTIVTETKYYDYSKLDSYHKSWSADGKEIKYIDMSSGQLIINTKNWKDTICYSNYLTIKPKLPDNVDLFSIFTTSYREDSVIKTRTRLQTFDGDFLDHPCQCFEEVFHTEILDLECILSCKLDTISYNKYINHYRGDGKLSSTLFYKDSSWIPSERRTYDSKGNWLTEWNRCDTFCYIYDSLNRRTYQYFNYRCDRFEYFLKTTYKGDSAITSGTQDSITRLSSIKTRISDSTYLYESFYQNGDIHKTIYLGKDEEHPISKVVHKKNGELETTDFHFKTRDDYFEKITIRNGNQIRKKIVQTFRL